MQDRYGREIDYLRISITDRCNLRCRYCMPEDIEMVPMKEILTFEEIAEVAEAASGLGLTKIKITGGEPLVRWGVSSLIRMLKDTEGIRRVTLTTNGLLLDEKLDELLEAGIDGINISLDTLDPDRYRDITGTDGLDKVLKGLDSVLEKGIPVKINAVSIDWEKYNGITREDKETGISDDTKALIGLARENPVDVRFIELMPIGFGQSFPGIPHDRLIRGIRECFPDLEVDHSRHGNGPAVYYHIPGYSGSVGFISAIQGKFCDTCNRIRLTSKGILKSCLCYDTGVNIKEILRSSDHIEDRKEALRHSLEQCIILKPESHFFTEREKISEKNAMSAIGG
ncbi:MAG: GTP 3',8-cyclase MoaA [Lachnospiraceae bacterium]|nr:GTP 3',8-cyclase MoaA [Lachnospiraceae bacterium]